MKKTNSIFLVALAQALALAPAVQADGELIVRSDVPARVSLDGERIGYAPLTVRGLEPGHHYVTLQATRSGEVQRATILIPDGVAVTREFAGNFVQDSPRAFTTPRRQAPGRARRGDGRNGYVRRRNIGLGAAALGLATDSGLLTGIGIGGVIANEIAHDDDD